MFRQFIRPAYQRLDRWGSQALIRLLKAYRYLISPWLGQCCRFHPSCSEYAQQAIHEWGVVKGLAFTLWRLLRCHPWHPGGYDPVTHRRISP